MQEYARYQWYWNARTTWLAEHSEERHTERYRTNWDKRQRMTVRFNELREDLIEHARIVQACALCLGSDVVATLKDDYRFRLDLSKTGQTLDVYLKQWAEHLSYNPEEPPF